MKNLINKKLNTTYFITFTGILSALAIVLMLFVHIPLFPPAAWLEYDLADIPILLTTFLINPVAGFVVLLVVSAIQAVTVSASSGIIGFIMHVISSGVMLFVAGILYSLITKKNEKKSRMFVGLAVGLVAGGLLMTAAMIPLNIIFTPMLTGMPKEAVVDMIVPFILPFNLIKAGVNCVVTYVLYFAIMPLLNKILYKR